LYTFEKDKFKLINDANLDLFKKQNIEIDNRIEIYYSGESEAFQKFKELISKETLADKIEKIIDEISDVDFEKSFEIDGEKLVIGIKK
jgi:acylphosphatase